MSNLQTNIKTITSNLGDDVCVCGKDSVGSEREIHLDPCDEIISQFHSRPFTVVVIGPVSGIDGILFIQNIHSDLAVQIHIFSPTQEMGNPMAMTKFVYAGSAALVPLLLQEIGK